MRLTAAFSALADSSESSRRRRVLRGAVGSFAVTGAVFASAVSASADDTPALSASASASASPSAPASASPSATASDPASVTPAPAASASAPASTPAPASPSPSAPDDDHGSGGQGPVTSDRCVVTVGQSIGAGTTALMTISPNGPSVQFQGAGEDKPIPGLSLTRTNPKLPASAGFLAEILHPNSAAPQLRTNMEGGGHPASVHSFPRLPEGCSFQYPTGDSAGSGDSGGAAQTSVIPKGGVAAGYESPDGGESVLLAVGGAAAFGATGVAFVALRRRGSAVTPR